MTLLELREPTEHGPHYITGGSRYLVRFPGEAKAKGRTRATTFVKAIDDESNLGPWMTAMAVTGVLVSTPVRAAWAALLADTGNNPWYHSDEAKARAKELAEAAKEAGGANERRDTGTALHGVLEAVVKGRATPDQVLEEFRPFVVNALALLAAEGFEPVAELCEQTIWNARLEVVGRFDLILRVTRDLPQYGLKAGDLVIGDWKTGGVTWKPKTNWKTKAQEGWRDGYEDSDLGHCAQMAIYATADQMIVWPADQWEECELRPMPAVSRKVAVIVHVPSTEGGTVSLRYLDLEVGARALEVAAAVREIRRAEALIERTGAVAPPWPPVADREPRLAEAEMLAVLPLGTPVTEERKAWIVARVTRLVEHPEMGGELAAVWPLPGVRASQVTDDVQVDALAAACHHVEAQHLAVYDVPDPAVQPSLELVPPPAEKPIYIPPAWDVDAEGRDVAASETEALIGLLRGLDEAQTAAIGVLVGEASRAGVGISLRFRFDEDHGRERPLREGELATYRRWMIARALFHVALAGIGHEDLRDVLYAATGRLDARQLTIAVGAVVGTLTAAEAELVTRLAQRITDGTAVFTYAADGLPVVDDATRAALAA